MISSILLLIIGTILLVVGIVIVVKNGGKWMTRGQEKWVPFFTWSIIAGIGATIDLQTIHKMLEIQ